jgi:hypothetical protein
VRNPRGPVAVIGSHGECFSTMVFPAADGFSESLFGDRPPARLGEAWRHLLEAVANRKINEALFEMLNLADGDPRIPEAVQRLEHLEMFTLLGDPALRLPVLPGDVKLTCAGPAAPGKAVTVRGQVPARLAGARVRITLERALDAKPVDLEPVPEKPGPARDRAVLANHDRANKFALAAAEAVVKDGAFEARLELPAKLPWPRLTVRAYAHTDRAEGLGVLVLPVKKP